MQNSGTNCLRVDTGYITNSVGRTIPRSSIGSAINYVLANDFIPLADCTHNTYFLCEKNASRAYLYFTFTKENDRHYLNVKCPKLDIESKYEIAQANNKWFLV